MNIISIKKDQKPKDRSQSCKVKRVSPAEPGEKCELHPVEWVISEGDGLVLKRCDPCFQKDRKLFEN